MRSLAAYVELGLDSKDELDTGHVAVNSIKLLSDLGWKSCVWFRCKWSKSIAGSKSIAYHHLKDRSQRQGFNCKPPPFMHRTFENLKNHLLMKMVGDCSTMKMFNKIIMKRLVLIISFNELFFKKKLLMKRYVSYYTNIVSIQCRGISH